MNDAEYMRIFETSMQKLEITFSREYARIINSMYKDCAALIMHGDMHPETSVINRYRERQTAYLIKRYLRTADIFGRLERQKHTGKTAAGIDKKEKLSDTFWEAIARWARTTAALKVTQMDITSKKAIAAVVTRGINDGLSNEKIAVALRQTGRIVSKTRANVIARTETHNAANVSTRTMAVELGARSKRWMDAGDHRVRVSHRGVEGGAFIPINEKFFVGGERLECPGDPYGSADNIVNCRCTVDYSVEPAGG